jgi:arylsulfatase A-like enzyme
VADERRRAVVAPAAPWSWEGRVPEGARLALGVQVLPEDAAGVRSLALQVAIAVGRSTETRTAGQVEPGGRWLDFAADLSALGGRRVRLTVAPSLAGTPAGAAPRLAWSPAQLAPPGRSARQRPNILLIVVDTLRADRLTPYGYRRETSPEIARRLAGRGVVVEHAYAQAPWTIPSAVSYLTSRYPGELLAGPMEGYAVPAGVETMAERLAAQGYETALFSGNHLLRDASGFGRGFATRYTPPATPESNLLHADSVNTRVLPWLAAHQRQPFFLYLHYMDPHDPYDNPDLVGGRSPFYPDYPGTLSGRWVHGVYTGAIPLTDPERDVAHLSALYDSEVRYVDRAIGELLSALEPEVAAATLMVLTSDHGEELYEHGGWKHGQTLYQEQIRVPLLFRWDGRLPAGRRLSGTVELLDLLPTLVAAAGGEPSPDWQGIDLLPALAGEVDPPRRPAFAQHLASGPLRAAAVLGDKKLLLFNRAEPFAPANALIEHLWRTDLGRLERRELYDLGADAGERRNRAALEPEAAAALGLLIDHRLDRTLPGLRVIASGLPGGGTLSGRIDFHRSPAAWHPYFLAAADRASLEGATLSFSLVGEEPGTGPADKGLTVEGDLGGIRALWAALDGVPLAPGSVLVGEGGRYSGGPIEEADLTTDHRPRSPAGPVLLLWARRALAPGRSGGIDPEVEASLKALGYIQ